MASKNKLEISPGKSLVDELEFLRTTFNETAARYSERIEGEIAEIQEAVLQAASQKKISSERIRDFRDMLTMIRGMIVKPEKGRRKDLKKIDLAVGELRLFIDKW